VEPDLQVGQAGGPGPSTPMPSRRLTGLLAPSAAIR
jgi:hypothetical protein